jgi:restriction system protein
MIAGEMRILSHHRHALPTSTFTPDARSYVLGLQTTIVLIDGPMLAQLMMDGGIGVSEAETIRILRADKDYFDGI